MWRDVTETSEAIALLVTDHWAWRDRQQPTARESHHNFFFQKGAEKNIYALIFLFLRNFWALLFRKDGPKMTGLLTIPVWGPAGIPGISLSSISTAEAAVRELVLMLLTRSLKVSDDWTCQQTSYPHKREGKYNLFFLSFPSPSYWATSCRLL